MGIPHINLVGPKGAGKTTIAEILASWYDVKWISRWTTRPQRPGEGQNHEYEFMDEREFSRRIRPESGPDILVGWGDEEWGEGGFKASVIMEGRIFTSTPVRIGKRIYSKAALGECAPDILPNSSEILIVNRQGFRTAVPDPRHWPSPGPTTELMLSIFGRSTPEVKKHAPDMVSIFITLKLKEMKRRLYKRNEAKGLSLYDQWMDNVEYLNSHPERDCDYVVYNRGTPEECAAKIAAIVGLPLPAKVLR